MFVSCCRCSVSRPNHISIRQHVNHRLRCIARLVWSCGPSSFSVLCWTLLRRCVCDDVYDCFVCRLRCLMSAFVSILFCCFVVLLVRFFVHRLASVQSFLLCICASSGGNVTQPSAGASATACPSQSSCTGTACVARTSCVCVAGYVGSNGGPCAQCTQGHYCPVRFFCVS